MRNRIFRSWRIFALAAVAIAAVLPSAAHAQNAGPQKVLIGFSAKPGKAEENLVRSHGGTVKYTYRIIPAIAATMPGAAIAGLANNPRITVIEADIAVHLIDHTTNDGADAELISSWGVRHIGSGQVHALNNFGAGVKVAVIDTGVDYTHPELALNYAGGYDFVNNDNDPMDDHSHGTHVAGTIAAVDNGASVIGVAPDANIYALKVLNSSGSGSFSSIIAALDWCVANGIQVTNNSYGSSSDPGSLTHAAFDNAAAAGILNIAAAGNSGNRKGKGVNTIYPARYSSAMAVAATNSSDARASFSSTGPEVEIAAPGSQINSTKMGGGESVKSGTSMATPHVVGVAALVIASGITDANAVRQKLIDTAIDMGDPGLDNLYGHGLVDADSAAQGVPAPTTPPDPASSPNPADLASGVSAGAILSWTPGAGTESHDVYFGASSPPASQGNQSGSNFDPGALAFSTTYYWQIDEVNSIGTTTGTEWSFTTGAAPPAPGAATNPSPADTATGVSTFANLSWNAGSNTDSHDVYFGTDSTPDAGEFQGNQGGTSFNPGAMAASTTYYWQIDEVNGTGTTTGPVWSFTTDAAPATDTVTVLKAEYRNKSQWLTIQATSTAQPGVDLFVSYVSGGNLIGPFQMAYLATKGQYEKKLGGFGVPDPVGVTIDSTGGDSVTAPITFK